MYSVTAPYNVYNTLLSPRLLWTLPTHKFLLKVSDKPIKTYCKAPSKMKNTRWKNWIWPKGIHDYLTRSGEFIKPKEIPVGELDMHLTRFLVNARKANEPDTLTSSQGNGNRYLADKKLNINIVTVFLEK